MTFLEITEMNEDEARTYVEKIRWPNGPVCPHCGCCEEDKIYKLKGKATRPGVYKCGACRKQFTVTVGTMMERSRISLKKWVIAFHLMCSSKKGMSSLQLQRELGFKSYKTAWFMTHRIREAMKREPMAGLLKGDVEVDETYIGGKNRPGTKRGRGTAKTPVVALISRDGDMFSRPVANVTAKELKDAIRKMISRESRILTDEYSAYKGIGDEFKGGHETVNHSAGEYARGDVHVNHAECYFSLLKRGVHGTFHHVSDEHLRRYCNEFSFRWNHRKVNDDKRTEAAMRGMSGKRLTYRQTKAQMEA